MIAPRKLLERLGGRVVLCNGAEVVGIDGFDGRIVFEGRETDIL